MIPGMTYDAEIEYLQSSGTQWIDTAAQTADKVQMGVWVNTTGGDMKIWGNSYYLGRWADISWYQSVYRGTTISQAAQTWDTVTIEKSPQRLTIGRGGETFSASSWWAANSSSSGGSTANGTAVPLFAHINPYGTSYGDNKIGAWSQPTNYRLRISFFKAWQNGVLVRNFIPVRVGTVGYMYDRVTRRLFGNRGAGDFALGPDVAKPTMGLKMFRKYTAKDYVQDGLIYLYDGIENAGFNVHDPDATAWKNLAGNGSLSLNSNYAEVLQNGIRRKQTAQHGPVAIQTDFSLAGDSTLEMCVTCPDAVASGSQVLLECGQVNTQNLNPCLVVKQGKYFEWSYWYNNQAEIFRPRKTLTVSATKTEGYVDQQLQKQTSSDTWGFNVGQLGVLGDARGTNYTPFGFTAHQIRIYNRKLSPEEIAWNYEIDKRRFNI